MSKLCSELHQLLRERVRHQFPFDKKEIPRNGIYILFERGERGHGGQRIVRIGTHTGANQLRSRLRQHFLLERKDRSIFRKNIGRAMLNREDDPFLTDWNRDLTSRRARSELSEQIDLERQVEIEADVSDYIQESFSFSVVRVDAKEDRMTLESRLIATIATCTECRPSADWLGQWSPIKKIRDSGLWQVQCLTHEPFTPPEFSAFATGPLDRILHE